MKKLNYYIGVLLLATGFSACNKYLDVKPETSSTADDLYKSENGFEQHLNGVYLSLSDVSNYGGTINMLIAEVLGQRYNQGSVPAKTKYKVLSEYNYGDPEVKALMSGMWSRLYAQIANLNTMLLAADQHPEVFTGKHYQLFKAEALALRTFLYFDLMRTYGPVYASADSLRSSIPYYSQYSITPANYQRANSMMDTLLRDINISKDLFRTQDTAVSDKRRMNYYAATALQARMQLYRGDTTSAYYSAKEVIDVQPAKYKFNSDKPSEVYKDPTLSGDAVFVFNNSKLKTAYDNWFSNTISVATNILYPITFRLDECYDDNLSDVRRSESIWERPVGEYDFYTLGKFKNAKNVPVIRSSECYLIAAETAPSIAERWNYLNVLRGQRNTPTPTTGNLQTEIENEYRKEFFGEGQIFYYYKRRVVLKIPDPKNTTANGALMSLKLENFKVPIPDAELAIHTPED